MVVPSILFFLYHLSLYAQCFHTTNLGCWSSKLTNPPFLLGMECQLSEVVEMQKCLCPFCPIAFPDHFADPSAKEPCQWEEKYPLSLAKVYPGSCNSFELGSPSKCS